MEDLVGMFSILQKIINKNKIYYKIYIMNVSSTTGFLIAAAVLIVLFFIVIIIWIFLPEQVPGTPYAYRTSSVVLLILAFIFLLIGITLIFFAVNQPPNVVLT